MVRECRRQRPPAWERLLAGPAPRPHMTERSSDLQGLRPETATGRSADDHSRSRGPASPHRSPTSQVTSLAWCRSGSDGSDVGPATAALIIVGVLHGFDERRPAMAGRDRMTIEEVVRQVLRDEHADVIRESVRAVAQEMMEAEVCELIGAEHGERTEDRATHRNGYRPTAVGHPRGGDRAADPQDPPGQLLPVLPAAAQALRAGAGLGGAAGLCLRRLDPARRSARREPRPADQQVARSAGSPACSTSRSRRSASGRWRAATPICSSTPRSRRSATAAASQRKAVVVAHAVHETGRREIIGLDVGEAETEAFWTRVPQVARSRAAWSACSWPSATRTRA